MSRSKSRSGYLEFGQKKHSSFLLRTIYGSKICRGDALASQVDKEALVSGVRNSISLSENRIVKAAMMQKQLCNLEDELKNTKQRLDEAETERNRVNAELREVKELANAGLSPKKAEKMYSDLKSLEDSLSNSKKEIESRDKQISLLSNQLESAKVFEVKLSEKDATLDKFKKRILELEDELEKTKQSESHMLESLMLQTEQIAHTKMDLEESKLEVITLNEKLNDLQKVSKIALDRTSNLNLNSSLETKTLTYEIAKLKEEIKQLNRELQFQKHTSEESISGWTAKEMGFISCINKAYEENASLSRENNKLHEALVVAENTTRITREESFKLRDLLKQALNESSAAKEASNKAHAKTSELKELKDLLAEKEESIRALTKENDRLRITEVAAHENMKECKRILTAKAEANKHHEDKEHTDVFNSPVGSLYEEHLDGRTTPQQMFSFDFGDMKVFNKEDDTMFDVEDDPEKEEALKGSIFDTSASPKSEPRTPKTKAHHRRNATGGLGQFEEMDNSVNGSSGHHTEGGDDKWFYMYGLYNRKKLFKKIGELVVGKTNSKNEGLIDQGKEHGKEQSKEQLHWHTRTHQDFLEAPSPSHAFSTNPLLLWKAYAD
ncbi:hypothetical protein L1987_45531 [Smallanthus sonchifolius]|uniref:Uncharacterized protein n=1 Tax=Smallanthus sonchifolius TaxID=185202 RepID=A0ACB9FX40_9ASTR|nr:hypothetical protein L1987_45531 [Smallanthus sonchifolius]